MISNELNQSTLFSFGFVNEVDGIILIPKKRKNEEKKVLSLSSKNACDKNVRGLQLRF